MILRGGTPGLGRSSTAPAGRRRPLLLRRGPGAGFTEGDSPGRVVTQHALFGCLLDMTGLGVFKESTEGFDASHSADPVSVRTSNSYDEMMAPSAAPAIAAPVAMSGAGPRPVMAASKNGEAADAESDDEGDRSDDAYDGLASPAGSVPVSGAMEPVVQFFLELTPSFVKSAS